MEGYTNVIGSSYDFDDLDIEGRVDDWNTPQEEENKSRVAPTSGQFEEKSILNIQVKLDNGKQAYVFSVTKKKDNSTVYICHICSDSLVGVASLKQHVQSQKHRTNMTKSVHPRAKFIKLDPKENVSLEPGEPVPPGLEEMIIKQCAIQPTLDAYKSPLIGLEYLVELTQCNTFEEEYYYCLMCEKTGAERNMLIHLTSIYHNLKYLSLYFPTVAKKLHLLPNKKMKKTFGLVVTDIIGDIEAKYGRLKPFIESRSDFDTPGRMSELQRMVQTGPHLRESPGEYFDEKATPEYMDKKAKEVLSAPPITGRAEEDKVNENKIPVPSTESIFNKNKSVNVDKKQIRPRDDSRNSSPDIQIINVELPKRLPVPRKRSRSMSSFSNSRSRSRSRSRDRPHYSSRSRSHRWSRSRSRSPRYRRRSPHSPRYTSRHRSREKSPYRKRRYHSRERSREKLDRYGRSIDIYAEKYRRERTPEEKRIPAPTPKEKKKWNKFREELKQIENAKLENLKYFEKNPEKHPQYPDEWKTFWNRRYNELQRSGIDPSKHDFKPEWISFWTKRMKELYDEDLINCKEELRKKFDLPEDPGTEYQHKTKSRRHGSPDFDDVSPPTPDKKDVIADIKNTWKALTGSDIKDAPKRPLSPWEDDKSPPMKREMRTPSPNIFNEKLLEDMPQRKAKTASLIFILRKLAVLEQPLGYLAPKVFELMQQALALERIQEEASLDLLYQAENSFYLETVREKLIGLLCAGIVPRNMVNTARSAIKHIDIALYLASKKSRILPNPSLPIPSASGMPLVPQLTQYVEPARIDPVVVPGVGQVDKVAIAQQIATALIEQGRTDVTEAELGQLINAVVGMAEASAANTSQPMTTANFLQQLQDAQKSINPSYENVQKPIGLNPNYQNDQKPVGLSSSTENKQSAVEVISEIQSKPAIMSDEKPTQQELSTVSPKIEPANEETSSGALKLLQSAYDDPSKTEPESPKPEIIDVDMKSTTIVSEQELAASLTMFNNLSKDDQSLFVQKLKTSNPIMFKKLCPFIPISALITHEHAKRSPISISLSKEKSEQKIKPVSSGRLSPFSSRTGGANPTVNEGIIDIDDEDLKLISGSPEAHQRSATSKSDSTLKIDKFGNDDDGGEEDDDDDDDYSFEDVYKAAQEKLRQKELDEDQKSQSSTQMSKEYNKQNESVPAKGDIINKSATNEQSWTSNIQENSPLPPANNDQQYQYESYRNVLKRGAQSDEYDEINTTGIYQGAHLKKSETSQNYPIRQTYSDDKHPVSNTDVRDKIGQHYGAQFYGESHETQSDTFDDSVAQSGSHQDLYFKKSQSTENYSTKQSYADGAKPSISNTDIKNKIGQHFTDQYYGGQGSYLNDRARAEEDPYHNETSQNVNERSRAGEGPYYNERSQGVPGPSVINDRSRAGESPYYNERSQGVPGSSVINDRSRAGENPYYNERSQGVPGSSVNEWSRTSEGPYYNDRSQSGPGLSLNERPRAGEGSYYREASQIGPGSSINERSRASEGSYYNETSQEGPVSYGNERPRGGEGPYHSERSQSGPGPCVNERPRAVEGSYYNETSQGGTGSYFNERSRAGEGPYYKETSQFYNINQVNPGFRSNSQTDLGYGNSGQGNPQANIGYGSGSQAIPGYGYGNSMNNRPELNRFRALPPQGVYGGRDSFSSSIRPNPNRYAPPQRFPRPNFPQY